MGNLIVTVHYYTLMDFILYDIDNGRWVQPIHNALIPKES
jgi:hypothetical protein